MAETAEQVFRFARACAYTIFHFAYGLKEVLKTIQTKHYACGINPTEIGHLLRFIDEYHGTMSALYALKISQTWLYAAPNCAGPRRW